VTGIVQAVPVVGEQGGPGRVRAGLAVTGLTAPEWVFALASALAAEGDVDLSLVVVDAGVSVRSPARRSGAAGRLWSCVRSVDAVLQRLVCRGSPRPAATVDLGTTGLRVAHDTDHGLDVIINVAGASRSAALCRRGGVPVWWLDHDGGALWPDVASGYAETLSGAPVTCCRLWALPDIADAPVVLRSARFSTHPLLCAENREQLLWKSISLVVQKLRELRLNGEVQSEGPEAPETPAPELADVSAVGLSQIVAGHAGRAARFVARRLLWREQWFLLFDDRPGVVAGEGVDSDQQPLFAVQPTRALTSGPDRYWADPHLLPGGDGRLVLVEEYMYGSRRGRIALLRLGEGGALEEARVVVEEDCHLSYPSVFEHGGELYMVPESSELNRICAYRCVDFPWGWEPAATLVDGVRACDSSILKHESRWWLFATVREDPWLSPRDTLHVFYADDPLTGPWMEHPGNPVVCDARRARPAGLPFSVQGRLYRPSQDCSRRYGYGIRINEIVCLSPTEFREREVSFIEPVWSGTCATHTYARDGGVVVVDALRWLKGRRG